jgi:hypothetical protein
MFQIFDVMECGTSQVRFQLPGVVGVPSLEMAVDPLCRSEMPDSV